MDIESASFAAYLVAGLLFILALAGLSKHESAGLGNSFGIAGMVVALVATIALAFDREPSGLGIGLMIVALIVGAAQIGRAECRNSMCQYGEISGVAVL